MKWSDGHSFQMALLIAPLYRWLVQRVLLVRGWVSTARYRDDDLAQSRLVLFPAASRLIVWILPQRTDGSPWALPYTVRAGQKWV